MCKGCVTAGTRPVLVLTRTPELILEPAVLIGHDQTVFELVNLLADKGTAVQSDFDEYLTDGCVPVFERILGLLLETAADTEPRAVALFLSTGFR